jgi:hypothetical protein
MPNLLWRQENLAADSTSIHINCRIRDKFADYAAFLDLPAETTAWLPRHLVLADEPCSADAH